MSVYGLSHVQKIFAYSTVHNISVLPLHHVTLSILLNIQKFLMKTSDRMKRIRMEIVQGLLGKKNEICSKGIYVHRKILMEIDI